MQSSYKMSRKEWKNFISTPAKKKPVKKRGNVRKPKKKYVYNGETVEAHTKSEARALLKEKLGKLPVGAQIVQKGTKKC
jgi:hypothetical protein